MHLRTSRRGAARLVALPLASALGVGLLAYAPAAQALSTSSTANGASVSINDARRPALDTGSIRNVSGSRMEGFGNIFVHVDTPADEAPRMNDQMMRGFGLTAAAAGSYRSTKSVRLDDLLMTRKVQVQASTNTTSFFDTFTNTSTEPLTFEVSFGGSLGSGLTATSPNKATISATSNGDTVADARDRWITATTPGSTRPTGVVVGTGVSSLADQQSNPFTTPYVPTGSRANDLGFVRELTVAPGQTASTMQYVVVGALSDTTQIATDTAALTAAPDFSNLSLDEKCTLTNWTLSSTELAACAGAEPLQIPAADAETATTTSVAYDVTGKTIAQLQGDMTAGTVTSVQITKAYLDRIE
ncbi:MAG: amidase, partial [Aeromicrobium sp.]